MVWYIILDLNICRLNGVSYPLQDLKKYFDSCNGDLDPETVKVRNEDVTAAQKSAAFIVW